MNEINNRKLKGSTLIEVLVALVIATTILILFINMLVYIVRTFSATKRITSDSFSAMKVVEENADISRKWIENGKPFAENPGFQRKALVFFNDPGHITYIEYRSRIAVYEIFGEVGNSKYITYVNDLEKMKLPTPELESVDNTMTTTIPIVADVKSGYYGYYDSNASFKAEAIYDIADPNYHLLYKDLYDWYVSNYGFNIPYQNKDLWNYKSEGEREAIFPAFPKDYTLIDFIDQEFKGDKYTSNFMGRNVLSNVTPVSKNGKRGQPEQTEPILILYLPIDTNLVMAYDASLIMYNENPLLSNTNFDDVFKKVYVNKVPNIAVSNNSLNDLTLYPHLGGQGAELELSVVGSVESAFEDTITHTSTQYLSFNNDKIMLSESNGDVENILGMSVFAVARGKGDYNAALISRGDASNGKWEFGLNGFTIYGGGGSQKVSPKSGKRIEDDEWHIISATSAMSFYVDGNLVSENSPNTVGNINTGAGNIKVGGNIASDPSKVDIAEVLVFNRVLTDVEIENVNKYLNSKYGIEN